jgi:hypothetical protein
LHHIDRILESTTRIVPIFSSKGVSFPLPPKGGCDAWAFGGNCVVPGGRVLKFSVPHAENKSAQPIDS